MGEKLYVNETTARTNHVSPSGDMREDSKQEPRRTGQSLLAERRERTEVLRGRELVGHNALGRQERVLRGHDLDEVLVRATRGAREVLLAAIQRIRHVLIGNQEG